MPRKYKPEVHAFIAAHVAGRTAQELADLTNSEYGLNFTAASMKSYKANHNLKCGRGPGQRKGQPTKTFPAEVQQYVFEHYKGTGHQQMCDQLFERFGIQYKPEQIKQYYARHGLNSGLTGYFKKGCCPYKPQKGNCPQGCEKTWFKPGYQPRNTKPIGYERVNRDGYTEVKVRMRPSKQTCNDNFVPKQRIIWEQHNGPLPPGYVVIFKDGDKRNFDPENLAAITKRERLDMNRHDLFSGDPEQTEAGILLARLRTTLHAKEKELENEQETQEREDHHTV